MWELTTFAEKEVIMTNGVYVNIPKSDMPFFRKLSKKMGWSYTAESEKQETLKSIEQSFRELKSAQSNGVELPGVDQLFAELQAV